MGCGDSMPGCRPERGISDSSAQRAPLQPRLVEREGQHRGRAVLIQLGLVVASLHRAARASRQRAPHLRRRQKKTHQLGNVCWGWSQAEQYASPIVTKPGAGCTAGYK
jgi:hypothetical protein